MCMCGAQHSGSQYPYAAQQHMLWVLHPVACSVLSVDVKGLAGWA
jgi:hypothetical protein